MSFRPAGVSDGSRAADPIPTRAEISASYGDDPAKLASHVVLSFRPSARHVVDEAVAAFCRVLDGEPESEQTSRRRS